MITTTPTLDPTRNSGGTDVLSTSKASFGDNPFLKLLTEQLKNQTPLEPVDNASFMNQMASYTSMQEQRDLNSNMLKLLDFQGVLARLQGLGQGSALLGKEVSFADESGNTAKGTVESVFVNEAGDVRLRLSGDKEIGMREVLGIAEPGGTASSPPAASASAASPPAAATPTPGTATTPA